MYTRESDVEKMGQVSLLLLKHVVVIVVVVVDLDFVAVAAVIVVILVILSPHLNLRFTAGTSALRVSSLANVGTCTAVPGSSTPPIWRRLTLSFSPTTSVEALDFLSAEKLM